MSMIYLIIAFILNSAGSVTFKMAANHGIVVNGSILHILTRNYLFLLGCLFFAVNAVFFMLALRTMPLSVANPIMLVMSFVIVAVASFFLFSEKLDFLQLSGYALMILGVILIFYFKK